MAGYDEPLPYKNLSDITLDFGLTNVYELRSILSEYGVCIIENVLTDHECEDLASKAVASLEKLGSGADRNNPEKFGNDNTIPQTRAGMYQMCYANNKDVNWVARCHPNVIRTFKAAYAFSESEAHAEIKLRSEIEIPNAPNDLMVSGDGMTVLPNRKFRETYDWAHLDQMHPKLFHEEELANFQGQIGLTDCKHAFRVSVGSHMVHKDIIEYCIKNGAYPQTDADRLAKKKSPSGFLKLPLNHIDNIRDIVETKDAKYHYQCLIPAKKGSLILWDARCVHSSYRNPDPKTDPVNTLDGWRCIVYVSFRRKAFMTDEDKKIRANALFLNDTTSHWGNTRLTTRQRGKLPSAVQRRFSNPALIYGEIYDPPELNESIKGLTCVSDMLLLEPEIYTQACSLYESGKYGELKDLLRPPRVKKSAKKKATNTAQSRLQLAIKRMKKA